MRAHQRPASVGNYSKEFCWEIATKLLDLSKHRQSEAANIVQPSILRQADFDSRAPSGGFIYSGGTMIREIEKCWSQPSYAAMTMRGPESTAQAVVSQKAGRILNARVVYREFPMSDAPAPREAPAVPAPDTDTDAPRVGALRPCPVPRRRPIVPVR